MTTTLLIVLSALVLLLLALLALAAIGAADSRERESVLQQDLKVCHDRIKYLGERVESHAGHMAQAINILARGQ